MSKKNNCREISMKTTALVNKIDDICDYQIPQHYIIDIIKAEIKRWREL